MAGTSQPDHQTPDASQVDPNQVDFDENDPDAKELAEAMAAAQAEQAANQSNDEGGGEDGDAQQAKAEPEPTGDGADKAGDQAPQEPQERQAPPMIPKDRFDEVLRKASDLERTNAYLQGRIAALSSSRDGGGQQQPQQQAKQEPTLDEIKADIRAQMSDMAKKFDEGELTYSEMKAKEFELQDRLGSVEREIYQRDTIAKVRSQQPQSQPQQTGDSLYLQRETERLEQEHPTLNRLNDHQFNGLVAQARSELQAEGVSLDQSDLSKYRLRERIAKLSDSYAPMFGDQAPGQNQQQPPQQQPSMADARMKKLQQQQDMPPDLSRIPNSGGEGPSDGSFTDAQIAEMSDDEIAALPEATQRKLLGIQ